jgi:RNA polymerase sigma factor (sigma-70 family)
MMLVREHVMTYKEADRPVLNENIDVDRETSAVRDPIRRYLVEAARTPLLGKENERVMATRMARRRAMFQLIAVSVPAVWGPMVKLVRAALEGSKAPSKIFALGGVSEAAFHKHLKTAAQLANRLDQIRRELSGDGCKGHEINRKLLREGKEIAMALNFRITPLRRLLRDAERDLPAKKACRQCTRGLAFAWRLFNAFVETRNKLVSANLRLVVHVAKQVARHPSQLLDLIQEGNFGLLYATEKYDPREICQFHSYAFWWIKQSMTRAIQNKSRLIRVPVNLNDAPARIREAVQKFRTDTGRDPSPEELAEKLDLSRAEAERVFRANVHCYSLDQVARGDDNDSPFAERLADTNTEGPNLDSGYVTDGLNEVLATLTPREREVVALRFGLGHSHHYTLENIAKIYNLSRERVRQIEIKALAKLRQPSRAARLKQILDALEG